MKCPVCDSRDIIYQNNYRFKNEYFSKAKRYSCSKCKLHFANPMPIQKDLDVYNSMYHDSAHGGKLRDLKQDAFFIGLAKTRLNFITNNLNPKIIPSKILEIGPGPGAFAKVWLDNYPDSSYDVIESDLNCHNELNNLGLNIVDINNFIESDYELIIISHVLEHVTDPKKFLQTFLEKLKKGGHLFIEVPCLDYLFKKYDEPHLLFFDKSSMDILMTKLNLKLVKIGYFGIKHKILKQKIPIFFKRLRRFLWRMGIIYYHPQKKALYNLLKNKLQTEAIITFDAHVENSDHAWWLRVFSKKLN